jgi:hypothetical protein
MGPAESINFMQLPTQPTFTASSDDAIKLLRLTCSLSPTNVGYPAHKISTKATRSGAAMALYLAGCSTAEFKLLGRWKLDAFLAYLRPQLVNAFSQLSSDMTTDFHTMVASDDQKIKRHCHPNLSDEVRKSVNCPFDALDQSNPIMCPMHR